MAADLNPEWLSCLPSSWSYGVTRDGRVFFINEEAKSTTWLHPVTGEAVITGHRKTPDLPTGWEEGYTFEGARCFINEDRTVLTGSGGQGDRTRMFLAASGLGEAAHFPGDHLLPTPAPSAEEREPYPFVAASRSVSVSPQQTIIWQAGCMPGSPLPWPSGPGTGTQPQISPARSRSSPSKCSGIAQVGQSAKTPQVWWFWR
ncbi:hypothetical protein SKAU_G00025100 [Synaphobranchus kaupii]|uniref:WW domain-containing protein n=1 Tax=Synaphobranchus kaupii TaxID=118154 RepID=A0A9Q1JEV6_SYNKA|nr:hypothetical protein SKAU_G00025100 [Synaphobranchus kaupii]